MTTSAPTSAGATGARDGASDAVTGADAATGGTGGPIGPRRFLVLSLRPVLLYLASRAGVLLVAEATASTTHQRLPGVLTVWDSTWYLSIAQGGYVHHIPPGLGNPAQSNLGFFPLLPILVRATHEVTRFGIPVSGLLTTFVVGVAASVAVWWMLHDIFGMRGADRGTALIFFSPGAVVLSFVYSEAVTIVLVACTLMALRRKRWLVAGACAAVVTAADPVALAVIVPCVVAAVAAIRTDREWKALLAPLLAPLGIAAFFCYLWAHTGSPLEYFRAQRAGWQSGAYFYGIPGSFLRLFAHGFVDPDYAVKAVSAVVVVGLLVLFFRARPPAPWIGYVVAVLAFGAVSPVIGVTPRLILRGFPLLGVVGAKLPPLWFEAVLGLSTLIMAALAMMTMGGPLWTP